MAPADYKSTPNYEVLFVTKYKTWQANLSTITETNFSEAHL